MAQYQGLRAQMVKTFLVFTYIWQEDVAKIPEIPRAQDNNILEVSWVPGNSIVSRRNQVLFHFLKGTIHLHFASFSATKYF